VEESGMNINDLDVAVQRLELKPTDVVVLTCTQTISSEWAEKLRDMVKAALPSDNKVLVLSSGMTMVVLGVDAPPVADTHANG
jgi:hypothetical protein